LTDESPSLPWFRVKFSDGREVEVHSVDAIQIFADTFREELLESVSETTQKAPEKSTVVEPEIRGTSERPLPTIKSSTSTMDNIRALIATPWARDGALLSDLLEALESNAVPSSVGTVSSCLTRLVKQNEMRRVKKEGQWRYYPNPPSQ
jgi:hypothetical protein